MMAIKLNDILPIERMEEAAECLRTIAHPVRLRMIEVLLDHRMTVGEIAELCQVRPNVASEHLGKMRDRGLLTMEKDGRQVFYAIAEPGLRSIINCVRSRFGD
ncbi:MAG: ArsR family transcriptional regulator [Planctomycetota bacterium]|nr:MAG: ArsR family transcriptional regulator [Planctomycetota bacterium]